MEGQQMPGVNECVEAGVRLQRWLTSNRLFSPRLRLARGQPVLLCAGWLQTSWLQRTTSGCPSIGRPISTVLDLSGGICLEELEARVGIEPTHKGFADLSLTTWVPRPGKADFEGFETIHSCRSLPGWRRRAEWSGRRDLNSRPSPWQGDALPLSYSRLLLFKYIGRG